VAQVSSFTILKAQGAKGGESEEGRAHVEKRTKDKSYTKRIELITQSVAFKDVEKK